MNVDTNEVNHDNGLEPVHDIKPNGDHLEDIIDLGYLEEFMGTKMSTIFLLLTYSIFYII